MNKYIKNPNYYDYNARAAHIVSQNLIFIGKSRVMCPVLPVHAVIRDRTVPL